VPWVAPPEKDSANSLFEKRLWDAADQLRANSELEALNAAAQEFETRIASNVAGILEG
jgi:hypothetical protein